MSRYIDADRLNKEVLASWEKDNHRTLEASLVHRQEHHHLMHIIEKQPTADVVEVVRCKDCKHLNPMGSGGYRKCLRDNLWKGTDDYCSHGKRRE